MEQVNKGHLQSGFSFMEMMIVLVIMGMLVTFIGPRIGSMLGRGKKTTTQATLKVVKNALEQYRMDVGRYPESLEQLNTPPAGIRGYQGPYLDDKYTDPANILDGWNGEVVYRKRGDKEKPPFELYSEGDPTKDEDRIDA